MDLSHTYQSDYLQKLRELNICKEIESTSEQEWYPYSTDFVDAKRGTFTPTTGTSIPQTDEYQRIVKAPSSKVNT
jgi:hypothetical protein